MSIRFVKMSGAGNDFIVIDAEVAREIGPDLSLWTRRVCRRRYSVGADGVLVVERLGSTRVGVRFINPDGSQAFCGNGSRCAALYATQEYSFEPGAEFLLETDVGELPACVDGSRVRMRLSAPRDLGPVVLRFDETDHTARLIDAGTPHLLLRVEDIDGFPLAEFGPRFRADPRFGRLGVNVNLWSYDDTRILLRTWEKGVEGETLACGSGAIAAALAARLEHGGENFHVFPRSGIPLEVQFESPDSIRFEGEARRIFEGELGAVAKDD